MFEAITVHKREHPNLRQPFSVGHIAECLLFYGKVNVVLSPVELELLIRKCGVDNIVTLLESQMLSIRLKQSSFGSTQAPSTSRIGYGIYSRKGDDLEVLTYQTIQKVYRNSTKSNAFKERLLPHLDTYEYDRDLIESFLSNEEFTTKTFRQVIKQAFPDYPIPLDLSFRLNKDEPRHYPHEIAMNSIYDIDTNFDLKQFESELKRKTGIMNLFKNGVARG